MLLNKSLPHQILFVFIAILLNGCGGGGSDSSQATPTSYSVRVLYVIPKDRAFRQDWATAIQGAAVNLQSWYKGQLGGKTFVLSTSSPEVYSLPNTSAAYVSDTWNKVLTDIQFAAPVSNNTPGTVWIVYADVLHAGGTPGRLGAGTPGLTIMARQDLEGLGGAPCIISDDGVKFCAPTLRWTGGLGHELGHAFGLVHPPGCDAGLSTCDQNALMWAGYGIYPNTYFRPDDKAILFASKFIQ